MWILSLIWVSGLGGDVVQRKGLQTTADAQCMKNAGQRLITKANIEPIAQVSQNKIRVSSKIIGTYTFWLYI